jgi:hypothetical protein
MKVEINYSPSTEHYVWKLWTGPDGIDDYEGVAISLGECFEELIKYETLNGLHYFGGTENAGN